MRKEMKLVISFVLFLLSIVGISMILANIHHSLEIDSVSRNDIIGITFYSFIFSLCFFYLLFSKLGTYDFFGNRVITYLLFTLGLSLFLSITLSLVAQKLL